MMRIIDYPAIDENVLIRKPPLAEDIFVEICQTIDKHKDSTFFIETPYPNVAVALLPKKWRDPFQIGGGIPANLALGVPVYSDKDLKMVEKMRSAPARAKIMFMSIYTFDLMIEAVDNQLMTWRCLNCGRRGEGRRPSRCPSGAICMGEGIGPQINIVFDKTPNRNDERRTREVLNALCLSHGQRFIRDVS